MERVINVPRGELVQKLWSNCVTLRGRASVPVGSHRVGFESKHAVRASQKCSPDFLALVQALSEGHERKGLSELVEQVLEATDLLSFHENEKASGERPRQKT